MPFAHASRQLQRPAVAALLALALAACGASGHSSSSTSDQPAGASSTSAGSTTGSSGGLPPAVDELPAAEHPVVSQFPAANGHTLQQVAASARASAQFGAATGTFTPGTRRLAFALNAGSGAFIYAPTVVYVARTPSSQAQGPFPAAADPMSVPAAYRSKQNSGPGGVKAIYEAHVPLPGPGTYYVLALTKTPSGLIGAPGEIAVAPDSAIPDVGQRPPAIATDTLASTHGEVALLTTRTPPENMHSVSFAQVLGKQPVALLFSTPQLCVSKVCGPVTDIVASLQPRFRSRIAFIHEEVYVNNQPSQGLRPQLKAFHLETEPWLFTVNRNGVIAARLEGAFGVNAVRQALEAALR